MDDHPQPQRGSVATAGPGRRLADPAPLADRRGVARWSGPPGDEAAIYAAVALHTPVAVIVIDADRIIRYEGPVLARLCGTPPSSFLGRRFGSMVTADDVPCVDAAIADLLGGADAVTAHFRARLPSGRDVHFELTGVNRLADPDIEGLVLSCRDVTERVEGAARLAEQALHDALTGLPNRTLLLERLERALDRRPPAAGRVAVLFVDLDGFKRINDSLGHAAGDVLLTTIAERLRHRMRPADTVARLGGDEFVVVSDGVPDVGAALGVARRVHDAVSEAVEIEGRKVNAGCSIGVTLARGESPATLLQQADTALYAAKAAGRNRSAVYDPAMRAGARARLDVEQGLRAALEQGRIVVQYQPIVELPGGRMVSTEALVRLRNPDSSIAAPYEFLQVAEETGLIAPLGAEVLRLACAEQGQWLRAGILPSHRVSVNVSPAQLRASWLVDHVRRCLDDAGLAPDRLCVELTEASLIGSEEPVRANLADLVDLGVTVALDDFGTGWSGLRSLRDYPISLVKVDRSFVAGLGTDRRDDEVVRAIIELGHVLGMTVVAEGVETEAQDRALCALGCDLAQGFLYAPPMDAADLLRSAAPAPGADVDLVEGGPADAEPVAATS